MAMPTTRPNGLSAEMNVTPMIDILLVLIIIFMIISPMAPQGEDTLIPHPDSRPNAIERTRTLVVQVLTRTGDQGPQIKINQGAVSWSGLHDRLQDVLKLRAEKVVFVMADPDIEFEPVAQVIDIARYAGADKVGLMSDQPR